MRYLEHLAIQQAYDIKEREFVPPFVVMMALAFSLHLLVMMAWSLFPERYLVQVPLQSLNVQLGKGGEAAGKNPSPVPATPTPAVQEKKIPAPIVAKPAPVVQKKKPVPRRKPVGEAGKVTMRTPSLLKPTTPSSAGTLSPSAGTGGGMGTGAQMVERYTRQLSLQVQMQASQIHLTDALRSRTGGQIAVEILLVIGQDGALNRYTVTRSSGLQELDQAAIRAVHDAAPYPPPPAQYAGYGFKVAVFMD